MMTTKGYDSVLLFGAPGAGKGTQGTILGRIPGFFHLSCGDVFRGLHMSSPEGREIYKYSSRGELAPNDLTIRIWKRGMDAFTTRSDYKPEEDLLVLDGIPRNVEQAEMIVEHVNVVKLIHLVCPSEDAMMHRMRRRAIRENRADDANETVIRHRFEVYRQETFPVLDHYPDEMISEINAMGSPAEVLQQILNVVVPVQNEHFAKIGHEMF
jgi:adenylate kinase